MIKDIAQLASIIPNPYFSFHRSLTPGSDGLPRSSDEFLKLSFTSCGDREESASSMRAITPDAIGVAILVPVFSS